jgi:hypothetical protein
VVQKFFPENFFKQGLAYAESGGQKRALGSALVQLVKKQIDVCFTPETGQAASILIGPLRARCRIGPEGAPQERKGKAAENKTGQNPSDDSCVMVHHYVRAALATTRIL